MDESSFSSNNHCRHGHHLRTFVLLLEGACVNSARPTAGETIFLRVYLRVLFLWGLATSVKSLKQASCLSAIVLATLSTPYSPIPSTLQEGAIPFTHEKIKKLRKLTSIVTCQIFRTGKNCLAEFTPKPVSFLTVPWFLGRALFLWALSTNTIEITSTSFHPYFHK